VHADRRALRQILINLVNNAIKFTDQGLVRLEVGQRKSKGHSAIEIRISDTGAGIHPEDHERIFDAFTQMEGSMRRQEGAGLGLHLSQKLAALLGARIKVESQPDHGSIFTLTLAGEVAGMAAVSRPRHD
jgi:protein-histidine pros-kinase